MLSVIPHPNTAEEGKRSEKYYKYYKYHPMNDPMWPKGTQQVQMIMKTKKSTIPTILGQESPVILNK